MKTIDIQDEKFPQRLRIIKNPPERLYIEGNIDVLNSNSIAVIGSRDCSGYGEKWCKKFVKGLVEYDLTIVSGMAKGIDTIAHDTAIKYGGKTIAVLPSGFDNIFPKDNLNLYKNIINSGGAVVSEYPPHIKADSRKFLERNRLVSGLALGTLVIEAEYRSGTSVTARITKEQQKEVFCIPGSLDNKKSVGTNNLIKKGAKLVTCVEDIIENYNFLHKFKLVKQEIKSIEEDNEFLKILSETPIELNEICKKVNLSLSEVMSELTLLELDKKIKKIPGNRFIKV